MLFLGFEKKIKKKKIFFSDAFPNFRRNRPMGEGGGALISTVFGFECALKIPVYVKKYTSVSGLTNKIIVV
jgi:hypothetical protein